MEIRLTFQDRLKDLRTERGLTLDELATETAISRSALGKYESDECKEVSHASIVTLAKYYGVTSDYLLGLSENKNPASADLTDLHLQDDVIGLLKTGKLNNRLLGELLVHEDFRRFLIDVEIYVDGLAGMQIKNLNIGVDAARMQIEEKYNPDKDELYRRTLEAAHIDEGRYFVGLIHDDLDGIIADIREAHKADALSAPEVSPAEEFKKELEAFSKQSGNLMEKLVRMICGQFKINYNKLTDEQKLVLVEIFSMSEYNTASKTGKRKSIKK